MFVYCTCVCVDPRKNFPKGTDGFRKPLYTKKQGKVISLIINFNHYINIVCLLKNLGFIFFKLKFRLFSS